MVILAGGLGSSCSSLILGDDMREAREDNLGVDEGSGVEVCKKGREKCRGYPDEAIGLPEETIGFFWPWFCRQWTRKGLSLDLFGIGQITLCR